MEIATPNRTHAVMLAMVAGVFLAGGWLLRPRDIPESPPPVPSESELQEIARLTHRRSLESMTAGFADLATDVSSSLEYIQDTGRTGVGWEAGRVVTAPSVPSGRVPVSVLPSTSLRAVRRAPLMPVEGDWILAVWQTAQGPAFAATNFRQVATTRCGPVEVRELLASTSFNRDMVGGAIFNLDRALLAVILPCGDHVAAVEASSVTQLIARANTTEERLLSRYGLLFDAIPEHARQLFRADDALFVREVWVGGAADAAGVEPGDVLVSANQQPVTHADDMQPLVSDAEAPLTLQFRRGSRLIVFDTAAARQPPQDRVSTAAVTLAPIASQYRIDTVDPQTAAARAGLRPGDVLLRVDHVEPRTRAQAQRAVNTSGVKPMLLEVQRDQRRIAILISESASRE